jgi:hypothetical protein
MNPLTHLYIRFQKAVDDIPDEVIDELPPDVVQRLKDGLIDRVPDDAYENLSESAKNALLDRVPDFVPESVIDAVTNNPGLAAVLAIVGVVAVIGFMYGVAKSAFKAIVFFGVLAALSWYFFAQNV